MRPTDRRRGPEVAGAAAFTISAAASLGLAAVYWRGGQPQLEGVLLAVAFGGLGLGLILWANRLLGAGPPHVQERHPLRTSDAERRGFESDLERGGEIGRRTLLVRTLGLAAGAFGVAALFPLRSLGPRPGRSLLQTPWRDGSRLVTEDGRLVRIDEVPVGGLVTVFPEQAPGSADGQAVLVRVEPGTNRPRTGRDDWAPEGFLCYSKICTHAGCPVGLYEAASHQLLCPCHQSTFDVLDGAAPVSGPAAAALPQLPLRVQDGVLVARGDFSEPVGPAFWRRS